jgi:Ser/Thr protein kinase RdoA (MazF antagonist)
MVHLPAQRLAWFARSEAGRAILLRERRVLGLLAERCRFEAPRVLHADADGDLEVRTVVPGVVEPWQVYRQARADTEVAVRFGRAIGAILAEQHTRLKAVDLATWLPDRPSWPQPRPWIAQGLPRVIDDPVLIAAADAIIARYEATLVEPFDRVLVHGDVGFHNLGIDLATHTVHGIFDYADAACADRHHDFRYLLFDHDRLDLLAAARAVYEPLTGRTIDINRVLVYNAACAVTFLAYRAGTAPEDDSCGRTLAQDLNWTRQAITRVLGALR